MWVWLFCELVSLTPVPTVSVIICKLWIHYVTTVVTVSWTWKIEHFTFLGGQTGLNPLYHFAWWIRTTPVTSCWTHMGQEQPWLLISWVNFADAHSMRIQSSTVLAVSLFTDGWPINFWYTSNILAEWVLNWFWNSTIHDMCFSDTWSRPVYSSDGDWTRTGGTQSYVHKEKIERVTLELVPTWDSPAEIRKILTHV